MTVAYERQRLFDLCAEFADGDWIESKDQSEGGIRLIQTGNVGEGQFLDKSERARYISAETYKRLRCTEIFAGDCLISRLPDPVGRACLLPSLAERAITAVDCTIVRFKKERILPTFFVYYSRSRNYLRDADRLCTGATRRRISRSALGEIAIPVPPLAEQKRIVAILDQAFDAIDTAKENATKNQLNALELFDSYLERVSYMSGVICSSHGGTRNQTGRLHSIPNRYRSTG